MAGAVLGVTFRGRCSILGGGPVSLFDAGAVLVKFGKIAGARNVVFFNAKWSS